MAGKSGGPGTMGVGMGQSTSEPWGWGWGLQRWRGRERQGAGQFTGVVGGEWIQLGNGMGSDMIRVGGDQGSWGLAWSRLWKGGWGSGATGDGVCRI